MKVYLHAGDAMTVTLNTKSILSTLNPDLRLFGPDPFNPTDLSAELTTSFQDAGQIPFVALNGGGLGLRNRSQRLVGGRPELLPDASGRPAGLQCGFCITRSGRQRAVTIIWA